MVPLKHKTKKFIVHIYLNSVSYRQTVLIPIRSTSLQNFVFQYRRWKYESGQSWQSMKTDRTGKARH